MAWLPDGEKILKISLFVLTQLTNVTDTDKQTPPTPQAALMHHIARQKRCTSIVQRKLTKVDCSDSLSNIYVPRPGRFLALTAAALVYFTTIALRGTQPYIHSESRLTNGRTLDTSLKLTTSTV